MSMKDLLRGASLRGDAQQLDTTAATRIGRALGTLVRRRLPGGTSSGRARVVVARNDGPAAFAVRDGLVRGLLVAGHDVKDIGGAGSDVFTFALRHLDASAGVVVTHGDDGAVSLVVFLAGRPLVGEGLQTLVALADGDDFSAGEGSLEVLDVTAAFRAAPPRRSGDSADGEPAGDAT